MRLVVPPLASRVGEIAPLAALFLERACAKLNRPSCGISPAALECLERYSWPGNVRELRNVVERAAALCTGSTIQVAHLPVECTHHAPASALPSDAVAHGAEPAPPSPSLPEGMRDEARRAARSVEREHIMEALERCSGNQSAAARLLGISRRTLVARLGEYKIPRPIKDNQF
jgi:DNA-binding NtrC family response regulator